MNGRTNGRHRPRRSRYTSVVVWVVVAVVLAVGGLAVARVRTGGAETAAAPPLPAPAASASPAVPSPSASSPVAQAVPRPDIRWDPIPFPVSRKAEMAAYAQRHYGIDSWRLVRPHVIVEHFTASTSYPSAWSTFAHDLPDVEFHSLPANCAHFVIDTGGTIHQLVPLRIMCRHAVGLNWTAVGIEMVGTSDGQILGNPKELRAAVRLTAWLMQRLHIQLRHVIGHNESLDSAFHRERVASWRCQTHQDWQHPDMQTFRADVRRYLRRFDIAPGPPWRAHPQAGC